MNHRSFNVLLALVLLAGAALPTPAVAKSEKDDGGEVKGQFSPGGMRLTITSQSDFEQLWYLAIDYCDGSRDEVNARRYPSKLPGILTVSAQGYSFYADKPMRRALIKTLPIPESGPAINFRLTTVQRKCGNPDPSPQLYCNDVQVASVIHRSWEGEAIEFKSNRHVMRAGLSFPGVDGLAPARQPIFNLRIYLPSIKFEPADRTWTGTFISNGMPLGEYEKVTLVVQDDFGEQAKCPVGDVTILP